MWRRRNKRKKILGEGIFLGVEGKYLERRKIFFAVEKKNGRGFKEKNLWRRKKYFLAESKNEEGKIVAGRDGWTGRRLTLRAS